MATNPMPIPTRRRATLGNPSAPRPQFNDYWGEPGPQSDYNWQRAVGFGDDFEDELSGQQQYRGGLEDAYRGMADTAYQDLYNAPGYSDQERAGVLSEQMLREGMTPQSELDNNFLREDEWGAAAGDPWSRSGGFDPGRLEGMDRESVGWTRDAFRESAGGARDANQAYADSARGAVRSGRDATLGALDTSDTEGRRVLESGAGSVRGAVGRARTDVSSALNRPGLEFTDQDVAGMEDQAGQQIQVGHQRQVDDLRRASAASGQGNPMAEAVMRQDLERDSAIGRANAATGARVQARNAQLANNQNLAGMRSSAALNLGSLDTSAEEGLNQSALNLYDTQGARRASALQGFAGMEGDTELALGNRATGLETNLTGMRTGLEQDLGNRSLALGQYGADRQIDIARDRDDTSSGRAMALAQNRQTTAQNNQATRFGQAYQGSQALSGRYGQVGDARRQDQGEARNYWAGSTQYQGNQGNQTMQNRLNNAYSSTNAANQATNTRQNLELGRRATPGLGSRIAQQFTGAVAGALGRNPTKGSSGSRGYGG